MTYWLEDTLGAPLPVRHAVNVVLHAGVTFLVVAFALILGAGALAAGLAGALFALHPVHVEAVAGLTGRPELLAALFLLLALCEHVRTGNASPAAVPWRGFVWAFLAAGSKEHAWLLPVLAVVLDLATGLHPRRRWRRYLAYGAGIGAHLLVRRVVLGGWLDGPGAMVAPMDNPLVLLHGPARLIAGLGVVAANMMHLAVPTQLSPDYSGPQIPIHTSLARAAPWLGVAILLVLTGVVLRAAAGHRGRGAATLAVGGGILLGSAVLFMNLWLDLVTICADRVLYWPSVGLVLMIAGVMTRAHPVDGRRVAIVAVPAMALAVVYARESITYLPAWRSDETLFTRAVVAAPKSPRVWLNVAKVHQANGRSAAAAEAARRARTLQDDYQEAWANEGSYLLLLGRWPEAEEVLRQAARLDPSDAMTLNNLGVSHLQQGHWEAAGRAFAAVLRHDPRLPESLLGLGEAEAQRGRLDAAVEAWRRYLAVAGPDPDVEHRIAQALDGNRR
jgi:tetratricopeptide (TPR) repeat protein